MYTMKKSIALVLMLALCLSLTSALAAEYTLRTSTNLAATSTVGQGLAKFVELVNVLAEDSLCLRIGLFHDVSDLAVNGAGGLL